MTRSTIASGQSSGTCSAMAFTAEVLGTDVIDVTPETWAKTRASHRSGDSPYKPSRMSLETSTKSATMHTVTQQRVRRARARYERRFENLPLKSIRRAKEWAINLSGSWRLGHSNHVQYAIRMESSAPSEVRLGRKQSETVARASRAHASRDCVSKANVEHRMPGAASDLEAFSRQPTGLASRHRPSDRAPYHLPEPAVPLVLNRITIAMRPNSRVKLTCLTTV